MSVVAANSHLIKPITSKAAATTTNTCLISSLKTISFKPIFKLQHISFSFSHTQKKKEKTLSVARTDFNWAESPVSVEESEEPKIYVGNLSYDVDSAALAGIFEKAGVVEICEVIYNRETEQSRGFGFVTMSTVEEAEKAIEMFHAYELNGRQLTVNKAAPKGARPERTERAPRAFDGSSRIYVGNLPWSVDDQSLEQAFSEYGKVVSARVISDRETGRSRGFGFVVMSSESETKDAIANLDGQSLDGRSIRVNVAEDKPRQSRY